VEIPQRVEVAMSACEMIVFVSGLVVLDGFRRVEVFGLG
jgi:hypothetical protein